MLLVDAVCERDRLLVSGGKQADLLQHSGQCTGRERTARKAEAARVAKSANAITLERSSRTGRSRRRAASTVSIKSRKGQSAFRRQTCRATHIHQELVTALDVLPRNSVVSIMLSRDSWNIRTYGREGPGEPIVENGGDAGTSAAQEPRKAGRLDDRRPDSRLVVQ